MSYDNNTYKNGNLNNDFCDTLDLGIPKSIYYPDPNINKDSSEIL